MNVETADMEGAAARLGLSRSYLEKLRLREEGPRFFTDRASDSLPRR